MVVLLKNPTQTAQQGSYVVGTWKAAILALNMKLTIELVEAV